MLSLVEHEKKFITQRPGFMFSLPPQSCRLGFKAKSSDLICFKIVSPSGYITVALDF